MYSPLTQESDLEALFVALPCLRVKSDPHSFEKLLDGHLELELMPHSMLSLVSNFKSFVVDNLIVFQDHKLDSPCPELAKECPKEVRFNLEDLHLADQQDTHASQDDIVSPKTEKATLLEARPAAAHQVAKQRSAEKPSKRVKSANSDKEKPGQVYLLPQPSALLSKRIKSSSGQKANHRAENVRISAVVHERHEPVSFNIATSPEKLAEDFGLISEYLGYKARRAEEKAAGSSRNALLQPLRHKAADKFEPLFK